MVAHKVVATAAPLRFQLHIHLVDVSGTNLDHGRRSNAFACSSPGALRCPSRGRLLQISSREHCRSPTGRHTAAALRFEQLLCLLHVARTDLDHHHTTFSGGGASVPFFLGLFPF